MHCKRRGTLRTLIRGRLKYHPDAQAEDFLRHLDLQRILVKLLLRKGEEIQGATWICSKSLLNELCHRP